MPEPIKQTDVEPIEQKSQTQDADAQRILDDLNGKTPEDNDNVNLPSEQGEEANNDNKQSDNSDEILLAGKYKSVDDLKKGIKSLGSNLPDFILDEMSSDSLEKYYIDQRKEFSSKNDGDRKHLKDEPKKEEKSDDKKDGEPETDANDLLRNIEQTLKDGKEITPEMYDELNKAGVPDLAIDRFLDGVKSEMVEFTNKVFEQAGGQENFEKIKAWAEQNIPQETMNSIAKMDYNGMLVAMQGIKAEYEKANPQENKPTRITGSTNTSNNGSSYRDMSEYMQDVRDKRYGKDKLYTQKVEDKIRRSNFKK